MPLVTSLYQLLCNKIHPALNILSVVSTVCLYYALAGNENFCAFRYPSHEQLQVIYGTYLTPVLQQQLSSHPVWGNQSRIHSLAGSMIQLYDQMRTKFTIDQYSHYQFTPRDLTRWVIGLLRYNLAGGQRDSTADTLVTIWAYEASRLFCDRLVGDEDRSKFYSALSTIVRTDWSANVMDGITSKLLVHVVFL